MIIRALGDRIYGTGVVLANLRGQLRVPYLHEEKLAALRDHRLRAIVRYAAETVPFYHNLFKAEGIDPRAIRTVADLERLPLVDKSMVRKNPNLFVSTSRRGTNAIPFTSSGTTGSPLLVWHDRHSILANMAFGARERQVRSEVLGNGFSYKTLAINYPGNIVRKVRDFCRKMTFNPARAEPFTLSILQPLDDLVAGINQYRPDVIISYGSYLETLFRTIQQRRLHMHLPRLILYGGDGMTSESRAFIEAEFAIPVLSCYQAVESFKIGYFCKERRGFHLHSDLCHLKIIDADGAKLKSGEKGEVVISNLVNHGTILLNYRLGDIGATSNEPCPCGRTLPLLTELEGRTEDIIFLADGGLVHPRIVWSVIKQKPEVLQYQLIQHEQSQFELRLVTTDEQAYQNAVPGLLTGLQQLLGPTAKIDHGYYQEIQTGEGGKFRAVVSRCRQQELQ